MDITDLTKALHAKINTATNTQEVLALSKAIERLNIGSVRTVSTYTGLSSLFVLDGEVIFVEDENVLYYSFYGYWFKINTDAALRAWAWGNNTGGKLGDNTVVGKSSPISVVGGFRDWTQVSAGSLHSLGLRSDGTLWAWGGNSLGQLGDNTTTGKSSPVSVLGGFTDWVQINSGSTHSIGLRSNGTTWAWGYNSNGQLGDNSTTSRLSPVSIVGGFTDWVQISSGSRNSVGLRSNGTAWAWGNNSNGQLGDNTTTGKSSPVSVLGGFSDWTQLSTGGDHNVGIRTNGTAWSWGSNGRGKLGDGTVVDKSSPVSVIGGFADWTQVSAAATHTVAIRSNGTAWAWGGNQYFLYSTVYTGGLGDGTGLDRSSPVSVIGGFTDWVQVRAGVDHSTGLRANGTAWAWGWNTFGRLGDDTVVAKSSPVSVVGGFTNWIDISSGVNHVLAIRSS